MEKRLETLKDVTETQCSPGNWDFDPYMQGMANGMLLAVAIMEGKDPEFKSAPLRWGCEVSLFSRVRRFFKRKFVGYGRTRMA